MSKSKIQILLADDHFVVKSGLRLVINSYYTNSNIICAASFKEILENLKLQYFDLLILDASFPEGNSLSIIDQVLGMQPKIKILMYTALEENVYAPKFFSLGAKGYLSKMADEEEIILAITSVLNGKVYMSEELKEIMLDGLMNNNAVNPFKELSKREFEIAMLLVQGEANLEISNKLSIKPSTISTYKKRIFEKLAIKNISELISLFKLHQI